VSRRAGLMAGAAALALLMYCTSQEAPAPFVLVQPHVPPWWARPSTAADRPASGGLRVSDFPGAASSPQGLKP